MSGTSPQGSPRSGPIGGGRQRRSAVRYTNLEKATSSPILTKPNRTVLFDPSIVDTQMIGVMGAMQGWRKTMEDKHALVRVPIDRKSTDRSDNKELNDGEGSMGAIIAVFDGHRGVEAASISSQCVPQAILELITSSMGQGTFPPLQEVFQQGALEQAFIEVDATLRRSWEDQSLRSSRAASQETCGPILSEGSTATTNSTSGDFVLSNPTSGQSSPQEFNASTLRAPPTIAGGPADFSSITGTTAVVGVALPQGYAFINVGDSRSYLVTRRKPPREQVVSEDIQKPAPTTDDDSELASTEAVTLPLGLTTLATSVDHRTSDPSECTRIEAAGGYVVNRRVNGKLSVTRALGDFDLKPNLLDASCNPIICLPDVQFVERSSQDAPSVLPKMARRGTAQFSSTENAVEETDEAATGANSHVTCDDGPSIFPYDLIVVGCDGVWELQSIDRMAILVDEKLQSNAALLTGSNPSQVEQFAATIEELLKECVSELLVKCCAQSCDPNGTSHGADNLSLGMLLLRRF